MALKNPVVLCSLFFLSWIITTSNVMLASRVMAPKDIHVLIPRICDYVTLLGRRDFANVIQEKDLESLILSWILGWAQSNQMRP